MNLIFSSEPWKPEPVLSFFGCKQSWPPNLFFFNNNEDDDIGDDGDDVDDDDDDDDGDEDEDINDDGDDIGEEDDDGDDERHNEPWQKKRRCQEKNATWYVFIKFLIFLEISPICVQVYCDCESEPSLQTFANGIQQLLAERRTLKWFNNIWK